MNDKEFLNEVKRIVGNGDKNHIKILRKLRGLGFVVGRGGKSGHMHLTHPRLGGYKATIGSSESCPRWGLNFVSQLRHAMVSRRPGGILA